MNTSTQTTESRTARTSQIVELSPSSTSLPTPAELKAKYPLSPFAQARIAETRARLKRRVEEGEGAPIAIVGPCSIHCETAALEYAERLHRVAQRIEERVVVVMRVYFEKPRTTVGWKGFLYDPEMNGSDDMAQGLERARALMVQIAELGLPIATEMLDPIAAEYFSDCVSWVAIGARTSESQIHRQMASRLECPVGFKNGTDGSVSIASEASQAAEAPHSHLGIDESGRVAMLRSRGNPATHVVLRGGKSGPNFDEQSVTAVAAELRKKGRRAAVLVDCNHGNSNKTYTLQPEVARTVFAQLGKDHADVLGVMIESHLRAGKQGLDVFGPKPELEYGVSVTDGCIDFATTEGLLEEMARA